MADATLGIVLRTTPLRESDLVVVAYTEAYGRVSAVARGAKRSQRRFAGALSLLVLAKFQLTRRAQRELWTLESAEVVREWTRLSSDVVAVAHASYIAELVGALLPPEAPDPHALDLVVGLWESLTEAGPSPAALRSVELELLELAGHRPAIDACAACGTDQLVSGVVFDAARGGAVCRTCAAYSRGTGVRPIDPAALEYLRTIRKHLTPGDARVVDGDARFSAHDRTAGRDVLLAMVGALVARPLRSLEYIAKLSAAGR
ncbi:MAG: DNA repair protein RecO [Kofleriaceae bacterium]